MGTRSLTLLKDGKGNEIAVLYRQLDGYPEGHGLELAEFLSGMVIVNGIQDREFQTANGMPCLAAQVVAHFKADVGQFYLYPPGTRDVWEDYIYTIEGEVGSEPTIAVTDSSGERIFEGGASKVAEAIKASAEPAE
jgi:hypothetical protein